MTSGTVHVDGGADVTLCGLDTADVNWTSWERVGGYPDLCARCWAAMAAMTVRLVDLAPHLR